MTKKTRITLEETTALRRECQAMRADLRVERRLTVRLNQQLHQARKQIVDTDVKRHDCANEAKDLLAAMHQARDRASETRWPALLFVFRPDDCQALLSKFDRLQRGLSTWAKIEPLPTPGPIPPLPDPVVVDLDDSEMTLKEIEKGEPPPPVKGRAFRAMNQISWLQRESGLRPTGQ